MQAISLARLDKSWMMTCRTKPGAAPIEIGFDERWRFDNLVSGEHFEVTEWFGRVAMRRRYDTNGSLDEERVPQHPSATRQRRVSVCRRDRCFMYRPVARYTIGEPFQREVDL
jgi:hypothetical protein